jgi:hypothetical protein
MVAVKTPSVKTGWVALDFNLPDAYGKYFSLKRDICSVDFQHNNSDSNKIKGLVVMFICNHCPYVQSILDKLVVDMRFLSTLDVKSVAIMPNPGYPGESLSEMIELNKKYDFNFPYLIDDKQEVSKAYDAVCTPDFYGFDRDLRLQYRGRFDSAGMNHVKDAKPELRIAMQKIALGESLDDIQHPSIGCSIKWFDKDRS